MKVFPLMTSATRFKNLLQENSKMHVIIEDVIEARHNGIVAIPMDDILLELLLSIKLNLVMCSFLIDC